MTALTNIFYNAIPLLAPIEGAGKTVDCGVAFYNFHTSLLIFCHKYIILIGWLHQRPFLSSLFLSVGAIIGRPFCNFTRAANDRPYDYFYSTKKGIIVDNPF